MSPLRAVSSKQAGCHLRRVTPNPTRRLPVNYIRNRIRNRNRTSYLIFIFPNLSRQSTGTIALLPPQFLALPLSLSILLVLQSPRRLTVPESKRVRDAVPSILGIEPTIEIDRKARAIKSRTNCTSRRSDSTHHHNLYIIAVAASRGVIRIIELTQRIGSHCAIVMFDLFKRLFWRSDWSLGKTDYTKLTLSLPTIYNLRPPNPTTTPRISSLHLQDAALRKLGTTTESYSPTSIRNRPSQVSKPNRLADWYTNTHNSDEPLTTHSGHPHSRLVRWQPIIHSV